MLSSVALSAIAIVIAIILFIVFCVKGMNQIVAAVICTALVSVFALGGFSTNFFETYINGMLQMFGTFFLLFSTGCAFGGALKATGASDRVGRTLVNIFGQDNFFIAVIIITIIFGMTGAVPLVLMSFLSISMAKQANLPRYVMLVAVTGGTSIATTCVPGTLGAGNVIPTAVLGTTIYAGAAIGIVATVVGIILLFIFTKYLIKQARKNNIGYDAPENESNMERTEEELPGLFTSFFPVVVLFVLCFVFILGLKLASLQATVYATIISTILLLVLNHKYLKESPVKVISDSVRDIQWNVVGVTAVCGFATVVGNTTCFTSAIGALVNSNIAPYILIVVGVFVTAGMTADCIGGVAAFITTIGTKLMEAGVDVNVIHRLGNIASSTFDSMPHGGSVCLALAMFGYNHKQAYKYLVVSNIVIPLIYTFAALVVTLIIY